MLPSNKREKKIKRKDEGADVISSLPNDARVVNLWKVDRKIAKDYDFDQPSSSDDSESALNAVTANDTTQCLRNRGAGRPLLCATEEYA